jgi:hypothetical protein
VNSGGGVFGALIFVIGILLAFAVMFGFFLIVPFFIFLAGVVVMLVSDRRDSSGSGGGNGGSANTTVETVETTEVVREVKS